MPAPSVTLPSVPLQHDLADSPGEDSRLTRAEELRVQVADEITSGLLPPGTMLDETTLAARFGVSRTPVREAIRELAASGLVETRPHRGAVVARPSPARLNQMFNVIAELEALCAGLCALNMNPAERQRLEGLHDGMGAFVRQGDLKRYRETNERFHISIYAGSHNDYLAELTLGTRRRLSPFRRAQFDGLDRLSLSHAEHERVLTAILRGDRHAASTEMKSHIAIISDPHEGQPLSV